MADYRRLISYIYEYEGKQKGKNVGFAKLEARNGYWSELLLSGMPGAR